jgi:DNA-binding transcriptional MerR regulator
MSAEENPILGGLNNANLEKAKPDKAKRARASVESARAESTRGVKPGVSLDAELVNPDLVASDPLGDDVDPEIPDKLYFRIGEVARLAGIKPYVLRFWETEFSGLGPRKSGTGHRLYRRKEVEMVFEIKRLLYEQRFTIEGARKHLEARNKPGLLKPLVRPSTANHKKKEQPDLFSVDSPAQIDLVKAELRAIAELLK